MNQPNLKRFVLADDVEHLDEPWCHVEKLCNPESTGSQRLILVRATMPPGEAHNFHRHPDREEIIYVLEGTAEQWVGREKSLLGPGDVALIPANVPHSTLNVGETTLRFLAILCDADTDGPFTVDVFDEEPWKTVRPPLDYPGYEPLREK
jgi:quercetin dioxygenase-like cupin family protein